MFTNAKIISENTASGLYHATNDNIQRGSPEFVMSASELKRFAACPSKWRNGAKEEDSSSLKWGSAIDCLVTQPDEFQTRYAIKPDEYPDDKGNMKKWNGNATYCKEWAANERRTIISRKEFNELTAAVHALHSDKFCNDVIFNSQKQIWIEAVWSVVHCAGQFGMLKVKAMLDFAGDDYLADLKTAQFVGNLSWPRHCFKYGYHMQAALYLDMFNAATGKQITDFYHICQESSFPYQIGRRLFSQEFISIGRDAYQQILANYMRCVEMNFWPGYDDHDGAINGCSLIEPEAWMIEADYRNHKINFEQEEEQ